MDRFPTWFISNNEKSLRDASRILGRPKHCINNSVAQVKVYILFRLICHQIYNLNYVSLVLHCVLNSQAWCSDC